MKKLTTTQLLQILLLTSLALIASAYVLEHYFNAAPCRMCWWQRYAHWGIGGVALLGLLLKTPRLAAVGTLTASATGLFIAVWQTGGQRHFWKLPEFCQGNTAHTQTDLMDITAAFTHLPPRCDEVNFTIMHLSLAEWNIPVMLFTAFISVLIFKKK